MSDPAKLERRYRQLLACYPHAFRHDHEQEILAVLMAGADEGQQRPRLGEAANLVKHALLDASGAFPRKDHDQREDVPDQGRSTQPQSHGGVRRKSEGAARHAEFLDGRHSHGMGISSHDPARGRRIRSAPEQTRTAWLSKTQCSPRSQLLGRHRPCQWRRYRVGRDHLGSAEVGAARSAPGPDASAYRECRGPIGACRGTQPEQSTLARFGVTQFRSRGAGSIGRHFLNLRGGGRPDWSGDHAHDAAAPASSSGVASIPA